MNIKLNRYNIFSESLGLTLTLSVMLTLLIQVSCTSASKNVHEGIGVDKKNEKKTDLKSTSVGGGNSSGFNLDAFVINGSQVNIIYKAMVASEKKIGRKIKADKIHSTHGSVSCKVDGAMKSCYFRTRSGRHGVLMGRQKLPKKLSAAMWRYFLKSRPELKGESIVTSTLRCDYIGKKSPPFNLEKLHCEVVHPRLSNEALVVGRPAETVANLLRGDASFSSEKSTVRGSILCQWVEGSGRSPCVLRPIVSGVLKEKFIEIPPRYSSAVGALMLDAVRDDIVHLSGGNPVSAKLPAEVMGAVVCAVNSRDFLSRGRRVVVCRIAI